MSCWVCESWSSRGSTQLSAISHALVNNSPLSPSAAAVLVHQPGQSASAPPLAEELAYLILRCGVKDIKEPFPTGRYLKYTSHVTTSTDKLDPRSRRRFLPITVIRSTPDRTQLIIIQDRVPFHTQLMCSEDMVHPIQFQELSNNRRSECIPSTPVNQHQFSPFTMNS